MPHYRRHYVPGGTYFFTLVTLNRRPLFVTEAWRDLFFACIEKISGSLPFHTLAWVLMPDHYHAIWVMPSGDSDYSKRWRRIKEEFTKAFLKAGGVEQSQSPSRHRSGERGIWQRRFWEYTIRDEADLERCVDYIHCNPQHHGLVDQLLDWKWSSYHDFVQQGQYPKGWEGSNSTIKTTNTLWGEY